MTDHFHNILLWALPASGKSEVLTHIRGLTPEQRAALHIGNLVEIDDYPRVASYFEIDDEREQNGKPRMFTKKQTYEEGGFLDDGLWNDLNQHLNARYEKALLRTPDIRASSTIMLECARGGPTHAKFPLRHGYQRTLQSLSSGILQKAVVLYINVPPEEARRKNDERFDPKDPHGILSHRIPTNVMLNDYGCDDAEWMAEEARKAGHDGFIRESQTGLWIPYATFDNSADLTSFVRAKDLSEADRGTQAARLTQALETALGPLFERYASSQQRQ